MLFLEVLPFSLYFSVGTLAQCHTKMTWQTKNYPIFMNWIVKEILTPSQHPCHHLIHHFSYLNENRPTISKGITKLAIHVSVGAPSHNFLQKPHHKKERLRNYHAPYPSIEC